MGVGARGSETEKTDNASVRFWCKGRHRNGLVGSEEFLNTDGGDVPGKKNILMQEGGGKQRREQSP